MTMKREHFLTLRMMAVLALVVALGFLAGCTSSKSGTTESQIPPGATQLTGAGSTFDAVIFKKWFTIYHDSHPDIFVKYEPVGSGEGVRRFMGNNIPEDKWIDFGASDSAMSDAELAQTKTGTLMVPVTSACVVLAYNIPGFHGDLKLSRQAYAGIFLGEIKNWNDPIIAKSNPGVKLPNLTIVTAVRQDASGTTFAFTNNLSAINDRWRSLFGPVTLVNWPGNAMRANGNEGVAGLITKSEGSIGSVGYEFANRLGLDMAALENKLGNYIQPSQQSCQAGLAAAELPDNLRAFVPDPSGADSYPIVTYSWVLLRKEYPNQIATPLRQLMRWCLQDGQRYASQIGYVPLPQPVVDKALASVNGISPGG